MTAAAPDDNAFDIVVIGSGVAGLTAALTADPHARVALVTKGALDDGCTRWAQGGMAVATGGDDSAQRHFDDTVQAGRGLCDERAVRVLVEEAPAAVERLTGWGVEFDAQDGRLLTGTEAAHSRPRILHAGGDATGAVIENALLDRLRASSVRVFEYLTVMALIVRDGRCVGVEAHDLRSDALTTLGASAVVLASGGAGRLWRVTTNPPSASGEGVALAYNAGADVASMEFMQFHPTVLAFEDMPPFLLSEAMRGEGAVVVNSEGVRFLFDADERGELAGRDVVAQAIWRELARSGEEHVFLDITAMGWDAMSRFPTIHRTMLAHGIDITSEPIPIAPAAHYMIGGVRTGLDGATGVTGLYACGEVASTGVHGANRLASNSLLEGVVFGIRTGGAAVRCTNELPPAGPVRRPTAAPMTNNTLRLRVGELTEELYDAMWTGCGLVREAAGIEAVNAVADRVRAELAPDGTPAVRRLRSIATTVSLVCTAAWAREESRGSHFRSDFPSISDDWQGIWVMHKEKGAHLDHNT